MGDRQAALDVVPCDVVAAEVVAAAFAYRSSKQRSIRYAVAGPERTLGRLRSGRDRRLVRPSSAGAAAEDSLPWA